MTRMRCRRGLKPAFLIASALALVMVVLPGCGSQETGLNPPNPRVSTGTTITSVSTASAAANPFTAAALEEASILPTGEPTIVIEEGDESWVLPAAVCMRTGEDADIVLAAAKRQAATVYRLAGEWISGWPTTIARYPGEDPAHERNLRVVGVIALTLAGLLGQQAALEQAWVDYEQRLAGTGPDEGWGPPSEISSRVEGWKVTAQALTQAIAERFPPGATATSLGMTTDTSTPAATSAPAEPRRFQWYDPNGFSPLTLALDLSNPSILYAGTTAGLFKSSDGAESWQLVPGFQEIGYGLVLVVVDPGAPAAVYAWEYAGLLRSDDGGASWTELGDVTSPRLVGGRGMWLDPATSPATLYMYGGQSESLATRPEVVGVWRSSDRGETWIPLTGDEAAQALAVREDGGLPPAAQQARDTFLASFDGTITDADTGTVVYPVPLGEGPAPVLVDPDRPAILYLPMYEGVYKSTDGGQTWRKASAGLSP